MTGEYGVLDGALALAIPTCHGQSMTTKQTRKSDIYWKSYDLKGEEWFSAQISLMDFSAVKTTDQEKADKLQKLLKGAVRLNSEFLSKWNGFDVKTYLEFDRDWGLGSSSTLTYLVAEWADINPLMLHFKISDGSGYDVACAGSDTPITYQVVDDEISYTPVEFDPSFKDQLFFVHLNKKQSTADSISYYFKNVKQRKTLTKKLSDITKKILDCKSLKSFCEHINQHEKAICEHLPLTSIRDKEFKDFNGGIKSLGAWGGDFILAASSDNKESVRTYFSDKGYDTIVPYSEMIYVEKESVPA